MFPRQLGSQHNRYAVTPYYIEYQLTAISQATSGLDYHAWDISLLPNDELFQTEEIISNQQVNKAMGSMPRIALSTWPCNVNKRACCNVNKGASYASYAMGRYRCSMVAGNMETTPVVVEIDISEEYSNL